MILCDEVGKKYDIRFVKQRGTSPRVGQNIGTESVLTDIALAACAAHLVLVIVALSACGRNLPYAYIELFHHGHYNPCYPCTCSLQNMPNLSNMFEGINSHCVEQGVLNKSAREKNKDCECH